MRRSVQPERQRQWLVIALASLVLSTSAVGQSPTPFGVPRDGATNPAAGIVAAQGSRAQGFEGQGRSEVLARHGIVATSDPLAAQAGLEILKQGGNAVDAAVATAAVLDVTSQNDTGLAGDLFALVWIAAEQKLFALNAAGFAPAGWTPEYFTQKLGVERVPYEGVNAATVPGAVAGYDALLTRFGTMDFSATLERAARTAEQGWGQSERRHRDLVRSVAMLRRDPDSAATFLRDGEAPPLYSIVRNPALGRALRLLQKEGRKAFYEGAIAEAIVAKVRKAGGVMTLEDLAAFEAEWVEPISTSYHGYEVHQLPPPGQGFAALEMLNLLEACAPEHGIDLTALGPAHADTWHLLVEAKKLAYSDLHAYNADPDFAAVPVSKLLSKDYASSLCQRIDMAKATPPAIEGGLDGGTIYLAAGDRWGNMVSLVHSIYGVYGGGVTIPPYGMILHNRGVAFSLDAEHPNVVAPRKRPFHTIIAGFVTRAGEPLLAFGNMGGSVQPETHAQHMVNMIDHGMNVQMTTDVARFTHNQRRDLLSLEGELFRLVGPALRARGHTVRSVNGGAVGGYQGVLFSRDPGQPKPRAYDEQSIRDDLPVNGVYRAGSDHRKDGQAVGW
ncbi:MAG: gamma-glutamyltransferase family protein [Pseudomonadota bacterium]